MTTPNLPWQTTDPADLPQGVIDPSQAGTALQDQTPQKFTDVAASKFPAIASNTLAGSPSGGGPLGFVVEKFSQITSNVANADPATIKGPDDVVGLAGNFFSGLPVLGLISELGKAIQGLLTTGPLSLISGLFSLRWDQADRSETAAAQAKTQAQGALNAAQAADRKVTALLQGGVRTVYTSNTTWTPPTGLVKVGVLLYGGGRKGTNASFSGVGGFGGGVIYAEFPATAFTGSVSITIGAGSPDVNTAAPTSFGSFLSSANAGGGQLQNSTLLALASSIFPGQGGTSGSDAKTANNSAITNPGQNGGSTALANGGVGGEGVGGNGENAPVTGQYLAGGGGGAGGVSRNASFAVMANGGAGGFPGGGGGAAGRNANETYTVGGAGAPGLAAIIEFTQAA